MRSNYRKLGEYIELVNDINHQEKYGESDVRGVSNNKEIIKTKANNKGRDFSKFYIVAPNDFIYNSRTSRMGDKVGLGYNDSKNTFTTSFNNTVYRIKNEKLLHAYLFMWFNRAEFDRYARFHSWGSSTELFSWDDMCALELPVPSIGKQREIVREYNAVNDRITLNETLTKKLDYTANIIFKQWFVDFEFPISKEYAEYISKPELEGKPYKSSGGKMKYCEELECEIPVISTTIKLENIVSTNSENINISKDKFTELNYLDTGGITENHIDGLQTLIIGKDTIPSRAKRKVRHNSIVYSTVRPNLRHYGLIKNPSDNLVVSTGFCVIHSKNDFISNELILLLLSSERVINQFQSKGEMSVSTYPSIKPEDILDTLLPIPNQLFEADLGSLNQNMSVLFNHIDLISQEKVKLLELKSLLEKNIINRA